MIGDDLQPSPEESSLIARELRALWLWLRTLGASDDVADDLCQEAIMLWIDKGGLTWPGPKSGAFLRTGAKNLWRSSRRRETRRAQIIREEAAEAIWSKMIRNDPSPAFSALQSCLETLPTNLLRVINATYRDGLSGAEIAEELGINTPQVHQRLYQARQELRRCIEGKLSEEEV